MRPTSVARRLVVGTVGACFRYRVTGLAAEAAFFAVLSLPPLVFGLAGTVGYVLAALELQTVQQLRDEVITAAARVLTPESVAEVIEPTIDDVLAGGRADVISVGFVLALWSGSRALNVFVDTITIMYGLAGKRGIVRTRALSFGLYAVALVIGVVVLPLVLAGPDLVSRIVPNQVGFLEDLYWPTVVVLSVAFLATLYHLSVPVRSAWRRDLPGAALALLLWIGGSVVLRAVLSEVTGGGSTSVYGPLAAPIAVLLWLYLLAIAVLIGAALNAAVDGVWPGAETDRARHAEPPPERMKEAEPEKRVTPGVPGL